MVHVTRGVSLKERRREREYTYGLMVKNTKEITKKVIRAARVC